MRARHALPSAGRHTAPAGFTLLELLVAITILAFIAVVAWRGLSSLAATRERLEPHGEQVRALLAGFGQMEIDLANMPRNAVLYALPSQALRVVVAGGERRLQILRLAPSPDGSGASAVQTVWYRVHEGVLERLSTPAQRVYAAQQSVQLDSVVLMPDVDDWQLRVWQAGGGWIVPVTDADTAGAAGVEVSLQRHDGSILRRVFLTAG